MKVLRVAVVLVMLMVGVVARPDGVGAQSAVDYDADDDGLIEIEWLEQLDAVRWDLDGDGFADDEGNAERYFAAFPDAMEGMGCVEGCRGYELTRDLDFKSAGSYAAGAVNEKWTSGNGWLPIGVSDGFIAVFEGNERVIANLYINRRGENQPEVAGLFGFSKGDIKRTGLNDVDITGETYVGGIVGGNSGDVTSCYVTGSVSGNFRAGGLVGQNGGNIASSHAVATVKAGEAGGLVGYHGGRLSHTQVARDGSIIEFYVDGSITLSYATGDVSGIDFAGGLVGENSANVSLSYAAGNVASENLAGGLVGFSLGDVTSSYATGNVFGGSVAGGLSG